MAVYTYTAMSTSGQEVKDEIEAQSNEDAIAKIRAKKLFPTKVKEKAAKKKVGKKEAAVVSSPKRKMPISIGGVPRKQRPQQGRRPSCRTCSARGPDQRRC